MVVALLPLWGALLGAGKFPVWVLVPAWIVLARIEQRVLRLSNAYLIASVAAGAVWWGLGSRALEGAIAAHAIARASMIALAWTSRPAASGVPLAVSTWEALVAISTALLIAFVALDLRPAVAAVAAAYLVVRVVRQWFYRSKGGVDATALAIAKGSTEAAVALAATLLSS